MSGVDGFIQMLWKHSAQNLHKSTCGGRKIAMGYTDDYLKIVLQIQS